MDGHLNIRRHSMEQVQSKAISHKEVQNSIKADLMDLTDELSAFVKVVKDASGKKEQREDILLNKNQLDQEEYQVEQAKDMKGVQQGEETSAQLAQEYQQSSPLGDLDQTIETMMAEILGQEEVDKSKKNGKLKFEERLERLAELEDDFQSMQFQDTEEKETVERFFDNLGRFRNVKSRLKRLVVMEEDYKRKQKDAERSKANGDSKT